MRAVSFWKISFLRKTTWALGKITLWMNFCTISSHLDSFFISFAGYFSWGISKMFWLSVSLRGKLHPCLKPFSEFLINSFTEPILYVDIGHCNHQAEQVWFLLYSESSMASFLTGDPTSFTLSSRFICASPMAKPFTISLRINVFIQFQLQRSTLRVG